jgi:DNA-binding NarL/FixJ family response regulator
MRLSTTCSHFHVPIDSDRACYWSEVLEFVWGQPLSPYLIRILSVEDHPVFWEGLRTIINSQADMSVVAHARNYSEALEAFRIEKPDVTLMDIRLAGDNGIDAMIRIRQEFPQAKVMMLTTFENDVQRALKAGAAAYVLKSAPQNEVFDAIRRVHAGKKYLSPEVAALLA